MRARSASGGEGHKDQFASPGRRTLCLSDRPGAPWALSPCHWLLCLSKSTRFHFNYLKIAQPRGARQRRATALCTHLCALSRLRTGLTGQTGRGPRSARRSPNLLVAGLRQALVGAGPAAARVARCSPAVLCTQPLPSLIFVYGKNDSGVAWSR